jgi:hypothetical protein
MKHMTRTVTLGIFGTLFTWSLLAADSLPTLDQIAEQHRKALGGPAALEKASALLFSGDCESTASEESGPIQILVSSPRVSVNLKDGALRMGFSGQAGWRHVAGQDLQQHAGRQFAEIVTVFDPARVRWWKEWYPTMSVTGIEKVNGREAYVLSTNPSNKASEKLFIDHETGLVVRDEVMPGVVFTFDDYRPVNGVQVAFRIRQSTPASVTYTYVFKDVKALTEVEATQFEPK